MLQKYHLSKISSANFSLVIILLIIVLFPLFKGGNYPGVMSLFMFSTVMIFLLSLSEITYERDKVWLFVWGVFTGAVLVHALIVPILFANDRFFDNGIDPIILERIGRRSVSVVRTVEVWSFFTAMWLFAWRISILQLKQISIVLTALFFVSLFQAVYGLAHFILEASSVLGLWTKEYYLNDATGTFVNRNHFSGMLAIASPLIVSGLLLSRPLIFPSLSKELRVTVAALYLMVLILALVSSHSRMGVVAAIFGLLVYLVVMVKSLSRQSKKGLIVFIGLTFVFLFMFALWFGFDDIVKRYADLENGNSRLDVWLAMFGMPLDVWLIGIGPGAFENIFKIITPSHFSVRFVQAHNDYLEFVFEFGLLLSLLIIFAFFLWFKKSVVSSYGYYLKSGVCGSIAAISLHSVVDFNLQIPASALFVWLSVGLLANRSMVLDQTNGEGSLNGDRKRRSKPKLRFPKNKREWLAFFRSD